VRGLKAGEGTSPTWGNRVNVLHQGYNIQAMEVEPIFPLANVGQQLIQTLAAVALPDGLVWVQAAR
jgi:hypothetical protein